MRDTLGILASGLCLLHCLLTPLLPLLGGLGILGAFQEDQFLHLLLLVPVVTLALASFPTSCRRHQRYAVMIVGFSGALLLVGALYLEGPWELVASVLGAGLLIIAHWVNQRLMYRVALVD
ncbi:MerC family mercury resistance protein [Microbulbifer sp. A4B17]|uniref:MerC family mercury resistance protein n=1 Tax=Microbulbifer sp. A4B17 TaxID=359370 RepID=UPI0013008C4C|nr:MerC family mercury resistance protein [Microbulbifer sp. A4B17]